MPRAESESVNIHTKQRLRIEKTRSGQSCTNRHRLISNVFDESDALVIELGKIGLGFKAVCRSIAHDYKEKLLVPEALYLYSCSY